MPQNVDRAQVLGAELGSNGTFGRDLRIHGSLTWLWTRDLELDRALPLRPRLTAYLRPELSLPPMAGIPTRLYADVDHVGASFADPRNVTRIPPRTRFGVGAEVDLARGRLAARLSVEDLFDARGFDVLGFPLPGRSVYLTVSIRTEPRP